MTLEQRIKKHIESTKAHIARLEESNSVDSETIHIMKELLKLDVKVFETELQKQPEDLHVFRSGKCPCCKRSVIQSIDEKRCRRCRQRLKWDSNE